MRQTKVKERQTKVKEWTVLLEAADEGGLSTMKPETFRRLVDSWAVAAPTTLYSPNRYALQVTLPAADAPSALTVALSLWKDALRRSGLPEWDLVRAEVLTAAELELELQTAERAVDRSDALDPPLPAPERLLGEELLRRALHDTVTGLPTRETFLDEVRRALLTPVDGPMVRAVLAVTLDAGAPGERLAQDEVTDELSAVLAGRLTAAVRRGDPVARVGAGEFAALVTLPCPDHAERLALRVVHSTRSAGDHLGRPITVSVGVATASCRDDDHEELLVTAELAMVAAHDAGGDRHVYFGAANTRSEHDAAG